MDQVSRARGSCLNLVQPLSFSIIEISREPGVLGAKKLVRKAPKRFKTQGWPIYWRMSSCVAWMVNGLLVRRPFRVRPRPSPFLALDLFARSESFRLRTPDALVGANSQESDPNSQSAFHEGTTNSVPLVHRKGRYDLGSSHFKLLTKRYNVDGIPMLIVVKPDGSIITRDGRSEVLDKVVALFFSAHWCAPGRGFTPVLKEFYEELEERPFEVVFVSCDKNESELLAYMADSHANWLYIPFSSCQITLLTKRYNVDGIPMLIVVKPDGSIITRDGRSEVLKGERGPVLSEDLLDRLERLAISLENVANRLEKEQRGQSDEGKAGDSSSCARRGLGREGDVL
uniref:protein-disulfide reductase n=1 Tax=Steinernema glaseri TaxID=37863 RepID=A0A1I7Z2L4_9BILA